MFRKVGFGFGSVGAAEGLSVVQAPSCRPGLCPTHQARVEEEAPDPGASLGDPT